MQSLKKFAFPTLIAASITLLLAQCSVGNLLPAVIGKEMWLSDDESTLKQEVSRQIPIGSSIADAKFSLQLKSAGSKRAVGVDWAVFDSYFR